MRGEERRQRPILMVLDVEQRIAKECPLRRVKRLADTVRGERMFCEQLDYNSLVGWCLDLELDEPSFAPSTFSRNRARLLEDAVARGFFRD
jgi:Transposase domain (DUF772)